MIMMNSRLVRIFGLYLWYLKWISFIRFFYSTDEIVKLKDCGKGKKK